MVCVSKPKKQQENTAVNILQNFATESRYDSLLTQQNTQVMITSRSLYKLIKTETRPTGHSCLPSTDLPVSAEV